MKLKNKNIWVCDECGKSSKEYADFNDADQTPSSDYCKECHPIRMTPLQLVEWLANGNGYACRQNKDYTTHLDFDFSTNKLDGFRVPDIKKQLPYDEHQFVVRYFDESNPRHQKAYWLIPTEEMFLEDCRNKGKSK